jgi:hypothetical protein
LEWSGEAEITWNVRAYIFMIILKWIFMKLDRGMEWNVLAEYWNRWWAVVMR